MDASACLFVDFLNISAVYIHRFINTALMIDRLESRGSGRRTQSIGAESVRVKSHIKLMGDRLEARGSGRRVGQFINRLESRGSGRRIYPIGLAI
jgi:hypothetical protein